MSRRESARSKMPCMCRVSGVSSQGLGGTSAWVASELDRLQREQSVQRYSSGYNSLRPTALLLVLPVMSYAPVSHYDGRLYLFAMMQTCC